MKGEYPMHEVRAILNDNCCVVYKDIRDVLFTPTKIYLHTIENKTEILTTKYYKTIKIVNKENT